MRTVMTALWALGIMALFTTTVAHGAAVTPKPQPGSPAGSVMSFVTDHSTLTGLRKLNSSLLGDGKTLERRTRDYAQHYNVQVESIGVDHASKKAILPGDFFSPVSVRTVTSGDFQDVIVHFNRLALFNMVQTPREMTIEVLDRPESPPGQVRMTTVIDYYNVRDQKKFFEYGGGQKNSSPLTTRLQEDAKVDQMRLQTAQLQNVQENGVGTFILQQVLDAYQMLPEETRESVQLRAFHWQRSKGLQLNCVPAPPRALETFEHALAQRSAVLSATEGQPSDNGDSVTVGFKASALEELHSAAVYSPLGVSNPFLQPRLHQIATSSPPPLDQIALLHAQPGVLGFGRRAEILLPGDRRMQVGVGSVISRYNGKIVAIQSGQITVEEKYLAPTRKWLTKQSVLKIKSTAAASPASVDSKS